MYQLVDNLKRFGLQKKDTLIDLLIQIDKNEQIIEEEQLFVFFDLTDKIVNDYKNMDERTVSELEQFIITRILQLRLSFDTKYLDLAIKLEENTHNSELAARFKQNRTQILLGMYDKKILNNKNYIEKIYFQFKVLDTINTHIEKLQSQRDYLVIQLENAVTTSKITEQLNKNGEEINEYQDMIIQRISSVYHSYNKYFKQKEMTMQQVADQVEVKYLYQPKVVLLKYKKIQDSFSTTRTFSQSYEQTRTSQVNVSNQSGATNEECSKIQEYVQDQLESSSSNVRKEAEAQEPDQQQPVTSPQTQETVSQPVPDLTSSQVQQISLLGSQLTNRPYSNMLSHSERDKKIRLANNLFNFAPDSSRTFITNAKYDDDEFVKAQLLQSQIFKAYVSQISSSPKTSLKSPPSYKKKRSMLSKSKELENSSENQDVQFGLQLIDYQLGDSITEVKNKLSQNKDEFVKEVERLEHEYLFKNVNWTDKPELDFAILEMPTQKAVSQGIDQKIEKDKINSITTTVNEQNAMLASRLQFVDDLETARIKAMKKIQNQEIANQNALFNKLILERWDLIDVNYLIQ